jgi:hypothetical protein
LISGFAADARALDSLIEQASMTSVNDAEPSYAFDFEWTSMEHRLAHRQIARLALFPRWLRALLWLVGLTMTVVIALALWVTPDRSRLVGAMLPWLLIIGMWVVLVRYGFGWLGARAWAKVNPPGHRQIAFRIDASGIRSGNERGELALRWMAIRRVVETPELFLFFYTWQCAQYLPKRVISASAADSLRGFLRSHLSEQQVQLVGAESGSAV